MTLVKVKKKHQVTIPAAVRKQAGVEEGDFLDIKTEKGKIILTPKSVVDRRLLEVLSDAEHGRTYGPFATADELKKSLTQQTKKLKRKK